jgi:hypothetical protein
MHLCFLFVHMHTSLFLKKIVHMVVLCILLMHFFDVPYAYFDMDLMHIVNKALFMLVSHMMLRL